MSPLKGKTVLVVDDEPGVREVVADEFRYVNANVLTASNGREALKVLEEHRVDAVVSDIRMPGGDGVELLEKVKTLDVHTPVVLLITGFSDLTPEEAYHRGAEAIFSKPIDWRALIETTTRALEPLEDRLAQEWLKSPSDWTAEVRVENMSRAIEARVTGIGRGGMFLSAQEFPRVGQNVTFSIRLEQSEFGLQAFEGAGVCRWFRNRPKNDLRPGFGIEFEALAPRSLKALSQILKKLRPCAFIPRT